MGLSVREISGMLLPSGLRRTTKVVVKAKCGVSNPLHATSGLDDKGGDEPVWKHPEEAMMVVPRWGGDEDILVIETYEFGKNGRDVWLGGNHLPLERYMEKPNQEVEEELKLYVSGDSKGGAGSGVLHLKIQWVPDQRGKRSQGVPEGNLHITPVKATALKKPDKIIRDLSTYVDYTSAYVALLCFALYLIAGFAFYQGFMAAPIQLVSDSMHDNDVLERQTALLEKIQGGNGDWDTINTLVFMVTSFTTVGYGNQPSMVATTPPCEYAGGPAILSDAPFSVLLPEHRRGSRVGIGKIIGVGSDEVNEDKTNFNALHEYCFPRTVDPAVGIGGQDACRVLADERHIFDFTTRQLYARGEIAPPRNFSNKEDMSALAQQRMPGDTGLYDCADVDATKGNETIAECYERFVAVCETSLQVWREFEAKKDISKGFTVLFVMVGIGILGAVVGVFGETLRDWANNLFSAAEVTLDVAVTPVSAATGVNIEDVAGSSGKGVVAAFVGLGVVIALGTAVYATLESMKVIDAIYFTVVTATTLGFGDYCPETYMGKIFTLFFVPISVVAVAGAIEHVASVPLNSRKAKLENYVLAQFGDELTLNDLADLRRSAGLREDEDIKANDFLFAMMIRLGYINPDDTKNILGIFAKLDTNQNGCISDADAAGVLVTAKGKGKGKGKASNGARKKRPKSSSKDRHRDRDLFDEDPGQTSNPVAASSKVQPRPQKKGGMSLGNEDGAERVRGPDGKTRRKVKKSKKPPRGDDEV